MYYFQKKKDTVNTTRDHFSVSEPQVIPVLVHKSHSQNYTFGVFPQKKKPGPMNGYHKVCCKPEFLPEGFSCTTLLRNSRPHLD